MMQTILSEKLRFYRTQTGFTGAEMGLLLGYDKQSAYYNYERTDLFPDGRPKAVIPLVDRGLAFAERLLVRPDWLFGSHPTMWSDEILRPLRSAILLFAQDLSVETDDTQARAYMRDNASQMVSEEDRRICSLIRFTHQFDPQRYDWMILQAVATKLFKGADYIHRILAGEDIQIPDAGIRRLSEVWELSLLWLRTGQGEFSLREIDSEKWGRVISIFESDGIPSEFFLTMRAEMMQLRDVWQHRMQKRTPSM